MLGVCVCVRVWIRVDADAANAKMRRRYGITARTPPPPNKYQPRQQQKLHANCCIHQFDLILWLCYGMLYAYCLHTYCIQTGEWSVCLRGGGAE